MKNNRNYHMALPLRAGERFAILRIKQPMRAHTMHQQGAKQHGIRKSRIK